MPLRIRYASLASLASSVSISLLPAVAAFAAAPISSSPFAIGLEPVTNVAGPSLDLTHAGDGTNRIFLAGQNTGDVRIFDIASNTLLPTPFLDVNGSGVTGAALPLATGGERGLLGMAFHPNYANPAQPGYRKFYTYTSENSGTLTPVSSLDFIHDELDGTEGSPANLGNHDSVIREWTVSANANQLSMLAADRREILRIRQPQSNHNGGAIKFGPDGMLYIALGDGGGGDDQSGSGTQLLTDGHTDASATVRGNAQDVQDYALARNENVLGKLLRIDPRDPATTPGSIGPTSLNGRYRIPADNPRMGATDGADEIWAYGLRNPFRMSFDRGGPGGVGGGGLYVADVGQSALEEVNVITKGRNYGWVYYEGTNLKFAEPTGGITETPPIAEYGHSDGQAVIGGFIYRGSNIPELYGKYIFGELGWNDPGTPETTIVGRIFHMEPGGGTISQFQYLLNTTYDTNAPVIAPNAQLYAFGEDRDGELYAMFANGDVRRILGRQWYAQTGGSWGTAGNWLGAIPNAAGAAANFLGRVPGGLPAAPTITLDGNRTVGSIFFSNDVISPTGIDYRIAPGTGGTLTLNNNTAVATVKVIKGNHEISAPISAVSNAAIDIATGGSLNVPAAFSVAAARTLTKTGGGAATLQDVAMQPTSTLAVNAGTLGVRRVTGGGIVNVSGGRIDVAVNGSSTGTSKVNALNVTGSGRLDMTDNKFIVIGGDIGDFSGGSYDGLTGMIARAYNFGAWDQPGILTSMPAAQQDEAVTMVAIAMAESVFYAGGTFGGLPVAAGDVLLMYTYAGDLNLDGLIDGADYGVIDNNVQFPGTTGYANGDINYDGVIDGADYGIIDNAIQFQGDPFPSGTHGGAAALTAIPEPSACGFAILAASLLVRRRRRRGVRRR